MSVAKHVYSWHLHACRTLDMPHVGIPVLHRPTESGESSMALLRSVMTIA
jgi:hypothetical protein